MTNSRWVWAAVIALLALQATQTIYVVHRESLTFDEANHMFAGYMMGHTGDYGLNPEHPPLVKLLAALPLFGHDYWIPPLLGRDFKLEAYLDGRDWLAHNDGATQHMVFRMRLAAGLLSPWRSHWSSSLRHVNSSARRPRSWLWFWSASIPTCWHTPHW